VWAKKRVETLKPALEAAGISGERLRLEWISASEGKKFADLTRDMDARLRSLDQDKIREENAKAQPKLRRMLGQPIQSQQPISSKIQ
jgi:F420-non-reducing hydrogenase iron-sulfur subunit